MEIAALWISIVSALGTGAAAIMAWQSRADSLRAEAEARGAEEAALETAHASARALGEANRIAQEHFATARADTIRREQAKWAGRLLRWGNVRLVQAQTATRRRPFATDPTFSELNEGRVVLGDPRADDLHAAFVMDVKEMVAATAGGTLPSHAMPRMTAWSVVIDEWLADPTPKTAGELIERRSEIERDIQGSFVPAKTEAQQGPE